MTDITPKEAIANLNHIYGMVAPDIQRSLDVAIKALENQTTEGDCISRKVVKGLISDKSIPIKFEEEKRGEWRRSSGVLLSDAYKAIDTAPPVPQVTVFAEDADEKAIEDMKAELQSVIEPRPQGDCISRKQVLEELMAHQYSQDFCKEHGIEYSINSSMVRIIVNGAQAVEHSLLPLASDLDSAYMRGYEVGKAEGILKAGTRPQGKWIVIHNALGETKYKCNQCQHYFKPSDDKNFCGNCGADMKGGAE